MKFKISILFVILFSVISELSGQIIFTDYVKSNCQSMDTIMIHSTGLSNGLISCQGTVKIRGLSIDSAAVLIQNGEIPFNLSNFNSIGDSIIVFSWFSPTLNPIYLSQDTVLLFSIISFSNSTNPVDIDFIKFPNSPTPYEFINSQYQQYSLTKSNSLFPISCSSSTNVDINSGQCINGVGYDTVVIAPSVYDLNKWIRVGVDSIQLLSASNSYTVINPSADSILIKCNSCLPSLDFYKKFNRTDCDTLSAIVCKYDTVSCQKENVAIIKYHSGPLSAYGLQIGLSMPNGLVIDSIVGLTTNVISNIINNKLLVSVVSSAGISSSDIFSIYYSALGNLGSALFSIDTIFSNVYDINGVEIDYYFSSDTVYYNSNCNNTPEVSLLTYSSSCDYYRVSELNLLNSKGVNSLQFSCSFDSTKCILDSLKIASSGVVFNLFSNNIGISFISGSSLNLDTLKLLYLYYHPKPGIDTSLLLTPTSNIQKELYKNYKLDTLSIPSKLAEVVNPLKVVIEANKLNYCPGDSVLIYTSNVLTSKIWNNGYANDSLWVSSSGQYYLIGTNANGCVDTSNAINIIASFPSYSTQGITACDSYTWVNGTVYTSSTSTPTYTYTASNGCDSIVTLDLTINTSKTGVDQVTACDSYTWVNGMVYTSSTSTPTYTYTASNGCDSIVTLDLTINTVTATATLYGFSLVANSGGDTYQWLKCLAAGYSIVSGAVQDTFYPSTNGQYAVVVSQNGCQDTSDCILVQGIGIMENAEFELFLYPNPASSIVTIRSNNEVVAPSIVSIYDMANKQIHHSVWKQDSFYRIDIENLPVGLYQVRIESSSIRDILQLNVAR